jgi:RND family efflux transporter MFP subunit
VFDNLSADYQIAQNTLERAQRRLAIVDEKLVKTRIHVAAPGTVLDVRVIPGQVVIGAASVNSGTPLLTIADLTKLIVRTHVNQYDVAKLSAGQEVRISGESMPGTSIRAHISFIAPIAVPKNNIKGFNVEARVDAADPRLRPGMTVTMTVPVARAAGAVSVPISAVFRGSDDSRVVYAQNGAQTETRTVEVGVTNLEFAEIKSGVQPGDRVLLVEPRLTQQRPR